jgi:RNA recognition motif-containing protein
MWYMFFALQIVEVEMPFDKTKNQRKGFCFITFESEQVVQELLKSPKQSINGKEVIHDFHFIMFVLMDC